MHHIFLTKFWGKIHVPFKMKYPDTYFSISIQGCNGIAHNVCMVKTELCLFTLRQHWKLNL